ncbi:MAG: hypothetical protein SO155_13025 [Candidatus Ventricola sp.]|nr:hypothetical protein [Candidatus Ventricola sp.]
MAFKQPRVPEYRESDGTGRYLHTLVLFLKDFCMDVWTANREQRREIDEIRVRLSELVAQNMNDEGGTNGG